MRQKPYGAVAGLSHGPVERVSGIGWCSRDRLEGPPNNRCDDEGLVGAAHKIACALPVQTCGCFPRNHARVSAMNKLASKDDFLRFMTGEDGAATPFAIFIFCIFVAVGGLAVDFNKAVSERTQMQLATDTAAHAAAYTWEFQDIDTSTTTAMETINGMLPDVAYRNALLADDIEYGFWDPTTLTFTRDPNFVEDKGNDLRSAVHATAQLEPGRFNQSRNILLSIIGQDNTNGLIN